MYKEKSIENYIEELGSGAPTPGGGAAAALSSAQGAALIMMVANHTIGKERYAEFEKLNKAVLEEASEIRDRLLDGIDRDAEAFGKVSAAYAMPRGTDEEKKLRAEAIAKASVEAAEAPLSAMSDSLRGLELAESMLGHSNPNLASDIYVAALSLSAGLESAAFNVDANLPAITKADVEKAASLEARESGIKFKAEAILKRIAPNWNKNLK